MPPCRSIVVARRKPTKRSRLIELLSERPSVPIAEAEWAELRNATGFSETSLRHCLRELDVPMAPLVDGVRQADLEELERTLIALEGEYREGNRERKQACRALVISARERAGFVARSGKTPAEKRK